MWLTIDSTPPRAAHVATETIQSAPPVPIAVPAPAEIVETASVTPAPTPTDDDQVRNLIDNWRSAWADRNVDAYLACYSADFSPANGQNHDAWAAARRKNISTRSDIAVNTNELKLERLDAQRMKAQFLQDYASGTYRETAQPKTLLLVRHESGWKIAGEWQGEAPVDEIGKP
jgi:ketosteroid isomerase-like protein